MTATTERISIQPGAMDAADAVETVFSNLVNEIAIAVELTKKYGPDPVHGARISGLISALFFMTDVPHDEIRRRADAAAAEQPISLGTQTS